MRETLRVTVVEGVAVGEAALLGWLLFAGSGAAVYAALRHGVDAKVAFGVAAVCVLLVLVGLAQIAADPTVALEAVDVFLSPQKLAGAFADVFGFWPVVFILICGAGAGFAAVLMAVALSSTFRGDGGTKP